MARLWLVIAALILATPSSAQADWEFLSSSRENTLGGVLYVKSKPLPKIARLSKGRATVPAGAPERVQKIIRAGNKIASTPYLWGGGHGSFTASGYDCSGSISYTLHKAGLIDTPMNSTALAGWGKPGKGEYVTIYANGSHAYMVVAGVRFDTSGANPSRWQKPREDNSGYEIRHPDGL